MTHQRTARQTRGFTLTEAAIVLGIVGLILGAIWVAAASVYANLRVKQTTEQILQIAQAVRALHATSTTITAITALDVARAGGIPKDMLDNATNPTTVTNVWGGAVTITAPTPTTFTINYAGVPQQPCADLAVRSTGAGRDAGLTNVLLNTTNIAAAAFPISVSAAVTGCSVTLAAGQPIAFTFRLRA
ncbi:type 4 pilus major pilin [Propionivibrio sp.]|uniref:type 4 pilus major pilin n=1 Tax=Propionivibrio sp. TaxID=2212460 RepID=UPI00260F372C|nr:type 4 pilus major pilin [Propionivibrio sp.]